MKVEVIKNQGSNEKTVADTTAVRTVQELAAAAAAAAGVSPARGSTKAERLKRYEQRWRQNHPGLCHVWFVIDGVLWNRFVELCCSTQKPNAVFTC